MTDTWLDNFKQSLLSWAKSRPSILGILLVGSYARGDFRPDSDVDLVVLAENNEPLLQDPKWTEHFGRVKNQVKENWGAVTSLRTQYEQGPEIEFGITDQTWAGLKPIDRGTFRVVNDGAKIIWDPKGILGELLKHISTGGKVL